MRPRRIQRKRTKGWRMPPNAVYVGRPTKWGNPFRVGQRLRLTEMIVRDPIVGFFGLFRVLDSDMAVALFRVHARYRVHCGNFPIHELRGKDLACWCPLDQPCHADVLLELANCIDSHGCERDEEM